MELLSKRERDIKNYWTSIENPDKPAVSGRRKRGEMDVEDSYDEARSKRQINKRQWMLNKLDRKKIYKFSVTN